MSTGRFSRCRPEHHRRRIFLGGQSTPILRAFRAGPHKRCHFFRRRSEGADTRPVGVPENARRVLRDRQIALKTPSIQASRARARPQNSAVNPPCFWRFLSCQRTSTALDFMHEVNPKRSGTTMTKRFVKSGSPPVWEETETDSGAKRAANRKRIAAGKTSKSRPVSRNPQIADSKSDRWNARRRTMKAASEGRGVTRYE